MKKLIIIALFMFPLLGKAQARLGSTLEEIKTEFSDKEFTYGVTDDGEKYIFTNMKYGSFLYYFDKETNKCDLCAQIPFTSVSLSEQIEIYNNKYVVVTEKSWKAYLEGGSVINIVLDYDEEDKFYVIFYKY